MPDLKSPNRNYPLPDPDNLMAEDALRIANALRGVDTDMASVMGDLDQAADNIGLLQAASASITTRVDQILDGVAEGGNTLKKLFALVSNAVRFDIDMGLTRARMLRARQNIGAHGATAGFGASTVLDITHLNRTLYLGGAGITMTLPGMNQTVSGDYVELTNITASPCVVQVPAADTNTNLHWTGTFGKSLALGPGQSVKFTSDGSNWVSSGRAVAPEWVLSLLADQGFTPAQKRQGKKNLGVFGVEGFIISQTTVLTSANIGGSIYLSGSSFDLTLPVPAKGDTIKLYNATGNTKNIRVPTGGYLYYGATGGQDAVFVLPPRQSVTLESFIDGQWLLFEHVSGSSIPNGDYAQSFTDAQKQTILQSLGMVQPQFQCYLQVASGAQLLLKPQDGNQLFINGFNRTIPAGGVALSNAGLALNTDYYVYAYWNGSAIVLEASPTLRATDTTYGHQIKSGDASRSLVGGFRLWTDGTFGDDSKYRITCSYYNRRMRHWKTGSVTNGQTASTGAYAELTARIPIFCFNDNNVRAYGTGNAYNNTAGQWTRVSILVNGAAVDYSSLATSAAANSACQHAATASITVPDGTTYINIGGNVSGGTGFFTVWATGDFVG